MEAGTISSQIANTSIAPIEYTLQGQPGPVVLVCHGTSSNCFSTEAAAPLVASGFRVLTPSRPGYGRTPLAAGRSAAEAAHGLIALLDCLEIPTCSVVATSGGGPTGIALAAELPRRVTRLVLLEAISQTEARSNEPSYKVQVAFYGPSHVLMWGLLGLMARLSPRSTARQVLSSFSTHDPDDALNRLSSEDVWKVSRFFRGRSSRSGALTDLTHVVGADVLRAVQQPTLVVHSREDKSVPFAHAEYSLAHIPHAELCESGFTGHFFWIGPDFTRVSARMIAFLRA